MKRSAYNVLAILFYIVQGRRQRHIVMGVFITTYLCALPQREEDEVESEPMVLDENEDDWVVVVLLLLLSRL